MRALIVSMLTVALLVDCPARAGQSNNDANKWEGFNGNLIVWNGW